MVPADESRLTGKLVLDCADYCTLYETTSGRKRVCDYVGGDVQYVLILPFTPNSGGFTPQIRRYFMGSVIFVFNSYDDNKKRPMQRS